MVKFGDVRIGFAEDMDKDSTIEIETRSVHVTIPLKHKYRINASAPRTNIAPRLLNKGEIFLSQINGNEIFTTSASSRNEINRSLETASVVGPLSTDDRQEVGKDEKVRPTLTLIVHNGSLTIEVSQSKEEAGVEKGFDSAT